MVAVMSLEGTNRGIVVVMSLEGSKILGSALGYSHSWTSISISKKKYSILVIEILYSISISPTPVLFLSNTLYPLFHILFHSLPLSLSATLFVQCLAFSLSRARSVAFFCAAGTLPGHLQARGADARYATASIPSPLPLRGADSLRPTTTRYKKIIYYKLICYCS